jgi:hypothetical protein
MSCARVKARGGVWYTYTHTAEIQQRYSRDGNGRPGEGLTNYVNAICAPCIYCLARQQ